MVAVELFSIIVITVILKITLSRITGMAYVFLFLAIISSHATLSYQILMV